MVDDSINSSQKNDECRLKNISFLLLTHRYYINYFPFYITNRVMQMDRGNNLIVNLTFDFAVGIIKYSAMLETNSHFILANQLMRSGTSIGANVREAQNAESCIDFIHKMKIAAKEADECEYWLRLCREIPEYPDLNGLLDQCISISKVLSKIIGTTKRLLK